MVGSEKYQEAPPANISSLRGILGILIIRDKTQSPFKMPRNVGISLIHVVVCLEIEQNYFDIFSGWKKKDSHLFSGKKFLKIKKYFI